MSESQRLNSTFNTFHLAERAIKACEAELGETLCTARNITSIPNKDKVSYLVQFESGLRIKLYISSCDNRYWSEGDHQYINAVGPQHFPRVLTRGERWIAFEWIEGRTLSQERISHDVLHQAVRILAAIHQAKVDLKVITPEMILTEVRRILNEKIPVLISTGIISDYQSHRMFGLYDRLSTDSLNISLIHGDFSPDNLVLHGNELVSVDNETIRLHVTEYDVSRAINFWDQWNRSGSCLLQIYSKYASISFDYESLRFWQIFDIVYRLSFRISYLGEFNEFFIKRLERILKQDNS
jgi:thiamine kinase-like enzyme